MSRTDSATILIGDRLVGRGEPAFVIAEVGQNHDGSLGSAHAYIDAVAKTGADAVKFQTHIAAAESTPADEWRVPFSPQDATRYDYWRRMEFTPEQWAGLAGHAAQSGLVFLSSPFSLQALELLDALGMKAWKIASGEVAHVELVQAAADTHRPLILSTGLATVSELDAAVVAARGSGAGCAVLACTSQYPVPAHNVGLNRMDHFAERYRCPVGLSDHSGTTWPSLAARTLGASIIEVHVTLSKKSFGPDVPSSLTIGGLRRMVEGIRYTEEMLSHPLDPESLPPDAEELRRLFYRSVVTAADIAENELVTREMLALKKPGTGLPESALTSIIGKRAKRALPPDHLISPEDMQ